MKNDLTSRYGIYALGSLFFYVVCCYIGFSEPWNNGVMKIFMTCILCSGALFVFIANKCAAAESTAAAQKKERQQFAPATSH